MAQTSTATKHDDGEGDEPKSAVLQRFTTPDVEVVARLVIQTLFASGPRPSPEGIDAIVAALDLASKSVPGKPETLRAAAPGVPLAEIMSGVAEDKISAVCGLLTVALPIACAHPFVLAPQDLAAYAVERAVVRLSLTE